MAGVYIYRERESTAQLDIPPQYHCHDNYSLHFSDFQLYQVTLLIDPPLVSYCSNSSTLSLIRHIQRPIVKQISFTATCSGMPYIFLGLSDVI